MVDTMGDLLGVVIHGARISQTTASFASPRDVARSKLAPLVRDIDAERFFQYVDL